jgi:hypothetical protein
MLWSKAEMKLEIVGWERYSHRRKGVASWKRKKIEEGRGVVGRWR